MKLIRFGLCVFAVFGLTACASNFADVPSYDTLLKEHTEQDGKACIRADRIRGWGTLDDDLLSVDAFGIRKHYLVTTIFTCRDIETSVRVGFSTSFTEFCGRGRDRIITRDDECQVQSIFEFDSREKAFEVFEVVEAKRVEIREELKANKENETQ